MPWIAKIKNIPKLTGGFKYVEGAFYRVKRDTARQVVIVSDGDEQSIAITIGQARAMFGRPQWVSDDYYKLVRMKNPKE